MAMPKKLQMYLIKNFLNQKDSEGESVPGSYNEVMELLYKMGGKEVLCTTSILLVQSFSCYNYFCTKRLHFLEVLTFFRSISCYNYNSFFWESDQQ